MKTCFGLSFEMHLVDLSVICLVIVATSRANFASGTRRCEYSRSKVAAGLSGEACESSGCLKVSTLRLTFTDLKAKCAQGLCLSRQRIVH